MDRSDWLVGVTVHWVVWRCALIMHGGQSAMQDLEPMKLESFVANLTLVTLVRQIKMIYNGLISLYFHFLTAALSFRSTTEFGTASGPIFLENLACSGSESNLLDCPHSVLGTHQCDHSQDSGVQCYGNVTSVFKAVVYKVLHLNLKTNLRC